jgi:hypothetical protein
VYSMYTRIHKVHGKLVDVLRVQRVGSQIMHVEFLPGLATWYNTTGARKRLLKIFTRYVPRLMAQQGDAAFIHYWPWLFSAIPRDMQSLFGDEQFLCDLSHETWPGLEDTPTARLAFILYKRTGTIDLGQWRVMLASAIHACIARCLHIVTTRTREYLLHDGDVHGREVYRRLELDRQTGRCVSSVHPTAIHNYVQCLADPDFPSQVFPSHGRKLLIACDEQTPCKTMLIYLGGDRLPRKYAFQLAMHGYECVCAHGYSYNPKEDLTQVHGAVHTHLIPVIAVIVMSYFVHS